MIVTYPRQDRTKEELKFKTMAAVGNCSLKANHNVRFANDVSIKVLPKQRLQMTSRERVKYWWTEIELGQILRQCLKELEIVKAEHSNDTTDSDTGPVYEESITARGLEFVHEDDVRMKQKKEVVKCMVKLLNRHVEGEDKKASKKFYKGAVKESTKRALMFGKLDELAVSSYLKNAERELEAEQEEAAAKAAAKNSPKSSSKSIFSFGRLGGGSNNSRRSSASRTSRTASTTSSSGGSFTRMDDIAAAAAIVAATAPPTPNLSPRFRKKPMQPLHSLPEEDHRGGQQMQAPPPPPPPDDDLLPPPPPPAPTKSPILTPKSRHKVSRQLRSSIISISSPKRDTRKVIS